MTSPESRKKTIDDIEEEARDLFEAENAHLGKDWLDVGPQIRRYYRFRIQTKYNEEQQ